ncbi:MAG: amidase family protein [Pirellulaceae bacterium]|nr:amidase family protein [Pirellulaceae bacterium]
MTAPPVSPTQWGAAEIARLVAAREVSAVEVARAFIDRMEEVASALNAVVFKRYDLALREAAEVDACLARGESLGPLAGVPLTVKECFHLAGTPATIGLEKRRTEIGTDDGILIRRLRAAGGIILGKTNVPQMMIWHECDNPVFGRTNNPWNLAHTPGGSTGGEGAIIAARGSPLGLGNDLGGSIRIPCHWCGIHGFKPTSLRLPRVGTVSTLRGFDTIVTQAGPMARRVEDLSLAMRVLADASDGYVAGDVVPGPLGDPALVRIDKLRIATWTDDGFFPVSPAIARSVREAADALRRRGAEIVELDAVAVGERLRLSEVFDLYCSLLAADGGAGTAELTRGSPLDWRVARMMWMANLRPLARLTVVRGLRMAGQTWLARLVGHARPTSAATFWRLAMQKHALVRGTLAWLQEARIDALLCPPHALPAPQHIKAYDLLPAAASAFVFNLLGLPAGVVSISRVRAGENPPRPTSRDRVEQQAASVERASVGLPVGVQVASLPWREDVALGVMGAIEADFCHEPDYPPRALVPSDGPLASA